MYFIPSLQKFSVVEQEKIDKFMLELDGTENKCKDLEIRLIKVVEFKIFLLCKNMEGWRCKMANSFKTNPSNIKL